MLMQTSILEGLALDWAVARAGGWYDYDKDTECFMKPTLLNMKVYNPSTDLELANTIILRENIKLKLNCYEWHATIDFYDDDILFNFTVHAYDKDMLVAAMRCYIARKLGSKVLIPWVQNIETENETV